MTLIFAAANPSARPGWAVGALHAYVRDERTRERLSDLAAGVCLLVTLVGIPLLAAALGGGGRP